MIDRFSVSVDKLSIDCGFEHLVAHPAKAAPAFLDPMEIGKALRQDRIARARTVFALAKIGQSDGGRRQSGNGDDHPVGEDFEDDLPSRVFVLAMGDRVDQGFPQGLDGVFVQADAIETDHAHRVAGVPVDKPEKCVRRGKRVCSEDFGR